MGKLVSERDNIKLVDQNDHNKKNLPLMPSIIWSINIAKALFMKQIGAISIHPANSRS